MALAKHRLGWVPSRFLPFVLLLLISSTQASQLFSETLHYLLPQTPCLSTECPNQLTTPRLAPAQEALLLQLGAKVALAQPGIRFQPARALGTPLPSPELRVHPSIASTHRSRGPPALG